MTIWQRLDDTQHIYIILGATFLLGLLIAAGFWTLALWIDEHRTYDDLDVREYRRNERGSTTLAEVLVPVALLVVGLIWAVVTRP